MFNRNIGKELFIAINNNDFAKFKSLISDSKVKLTLTDHCDPSLESIFGGDWSLGEGSLGRYENNTLLNCALSMERVNFAAELIRIHKETGRDIGIDEINDARISPLHMALMVNAEYLLFYDKNRQIKKNVNQLSNLKLYTPSEQKEALNTARNVLADLLPSYSASSLIRIFQENHRIMPQPILLVDMFIFAKELAKDNSQLADMILLGTMIMLEYETEIGHDKQELKKFQNDIIDLDEIMKTCTAEQKSEIKDAIPQILIEIEQMKERVKVAKDYREKIIEFISLMKQDPFLNEILQKALTKPMISREFFSLVRGPVKQSLLRGGSDFYDRDSLPTPNVFHLLTIYLTNKTPAEQLQALQIVESMITSEMLSLKNENNITLEITLKKLKDDIQYKLTNPIESKLEEKISSSSINNPQHNSQSVKAFEFTGQHNWLRTGAFAAAPASLAIGSTLLQLNDHQLNRLLNDKVLAETNLSNCVLIGVKFHTDLSSVTKAELPSDMLKKAKLEGAANYANIKDLEPIISDKSIELGNRLGGIMQGLTQFYNSFLENIKDKPWLKQDDMFFILTAEGKTLSFFSRNEQFYLINTSKTFFSGSMEVFNKLEDLVSAVEIHWQTYSQCDITTVTTTQRLDNKLKEEKVNNIIDPFKQYELIANTITNYVNICERAGTVKKLFNRQGRLRANAYSSLLKSANNDFEKDIIIYALLKNEAGVDLRTAVANALEKFTGNPEKDINDAAKYFEEKIQANHLLNASFPEGNKEDKIKSLIKDVVTSLNASAEKGLISPHVNYSKIFERINKKAEENKVTFNK